MLLAVEVAGVLAVRLFVIGVAGWAAAPVTGGRLGVPTCRATRSPRQSSAAVSCRIQGDVIFVQRLRGRGGAGRRFLADQGVVTLVVSLA